MLFVNVRRKGLGNICIELCRVGVNNPVLQFTKHYFPCDFP